MFYHNGITSYYRAQYIILRAWFIKPIYSIRKGILDELNSQNVIFNNLGVVKTYTGNFDKENPTLSFLFLFSGLTKQMYLKNINNNKSLVEFFSEILL